MARHLHLGDTENNIRLWDVQTGISLQTLSGSGQEVNSIVFSPDGKKFATANNARDVRLWDTQTGENIGMLEGHKDPVKSVVFSPGW